MTRPAFSPLRWADEQAARAQREMEGACEAARRAEARADRHQEAALRFKGWLALWAAREEGPATQTEAERAVRCLACDGDGSVSDGWCLDCEGSGIADPADLLQLAEACAHLGCASPRVAGGVCLEHLDDGTDGTDDDAGGA